MPLFASAKGLFRAGNQRDFAFNDICFTLNFTILRIRPYGIESNVPFEGRKVHEHRMMPILLIPLIRRFSPG
jgi:hypothetical protein